jgi:predicted aldo/keto reductase-like oxidoreductase
LEQWRRLRFDELAGQVRWRGISCHNPAVLREAIPSGRCDVVLFPVGPFVDERYIVEALPLARQHGVGTVAFKVFGAGKLLGNTTGYGQPLPATPVLPRLGVAECLHYTLTLDPDVALLGLSSPAEQDAAFAAYRSFQLLPAARLADIRARAAVAVIGKDRCWWNP